MILRNGQIISVCPKGSGYGWYHRDYSYRLVSLIQNESEASIEVDNDAANNKTEMSKQDVDPEEIPELPNEIEEVDY